MKKIKFFYVPLLFKRYFYYLSTVVVFFSTSLTDVKADDSDQFHNYTIAVGHEKSRDTSIISIKDGNPVLEKILTMSGNSYGVVFSPDGKMLYVSCVGPDGSRGVIAVYNTKTWERITSMPVEDWQGKGWPFSVVLTKDGKKLYVSNWTDSKIYVYDAVNLIFLYSISVGIGPKPDYPTKEWAIRFLEFSPDEKFLYAVGRGNSAVYKIDLETDKQAGYIDGIVAGRGLAFAGEYKPQKRGVLSTSGLLYIANENPIPSKPSYITVIDTKLAVPEDGKIGEVVDTIEIDPSLGTSPQTLAFDPDRSLMFVAMIFGRLIAIDVDPTSSTYHKIVLAAPIENSMYNYGINKLGKDFVVVTSQADRGHAPNSLKFYGAVGENRFAFINSIPTGGDAPYLMAVRDDGLPETKIASKDFTKLLKKYKLKKSKKAPSKYKLVKKSKNKRVKDTTISLSK